MNKVLVINLIFITNISIIKTKFNLSLITSILKNQIKTSKPNLLDNYNSEKLDIGLLVIDIKIYYILSINNL